MKSKTYPSAIALLFIFITACTPATEAPETIANQYWQLLLDGNTQQAEKLLTANSKLMVNTHSSRIQDNTIISNDPAQTIVSTTITSIDADNNAHSETFNTVLVLENNNWKIDINQSPIPAKPVSQKEEMEKLADKLSESMQENIETIDKAMDQGMELLNEALEEGSKEMSQSLLQLMNELNTSMNKSIENMKKRRQQQLQQDPPAAPDNSPATPDPRKGEGMI